MRKMIAKKLRLRRIKWRNRQSATCISHILCKTVVAFIILEGINGGGGPGGLSRVNGASVNSTSSQYYPQSTFQSGDYGRGGDSLINTFGNGMGGDAMERIRDRCGRFSLLRVLQQWESLQKRCRLGLKNGNVNRRNGARYEYDVGERNKNGPSASPDVDEIRVGKRSRHPNYGGLTLNNYYDENGPYQNHYYEMNGDRLESCCPIVFEVIAPIYGRNRSGHMVELYKDDQVQQEFYEHRCHKDYLEKPCRFIDSHHRKVSKCVQQYIDTYALVRSDKSLTGWSMEHIRVASGCACKIDPVKALASRRRKKLSQSQRSSQRRQQFPDFFMSRNSLGNNNNDKNKRRTSLHQFASSLIDY